MAELALQVHVEPPRARLVATPGSLCSPMLRGAQTLVDLDVRNVGTGPSGPLNVVLPMAPWLSVATPNPLPALDPGESGRITLQLRPGADVVLGPYSGSLVISGQGVSLSVPFEFTAVSEAVGHLKVSAVDEFSYYAEGSPKVTNATVLVIDANTGSAIATATTARETVREVMVIF